MLIREVRGLTLWRPWDQAIIRGNKRIENRPRRWGIEGYILALHAGLRWDDHGEQIIRAWMGSEEGGPRPLLSGRGEAFDHPGHIVGAAVVNAVVRKPDVWDWHQRTVWAQDGSDRDDGRDPWCYVLDDVADFYDDPIPQKGSQGLFMLEDDVRDEVVERYEYACRRRARERRTQDARQKTLES